MAGTGPTDLHDLALEFLAACEESLNTIPNYASHLDGAPSRSFVAPGLPAFDFASEASSTSDCDQLTVHVGPIVEGQTAGAVGNINRVSLIATIARCCLPVQDDRGNAPSPQAQEAIAEQINADKWSLWIHLHNMVTQELLFDRCCAVEWGVLEPLVPSGGCGGSKLTVTVCFDGYDEVLGT